MRLIKEKARVKTGYQLNTRYIRLSCRYKPIEKGRTATPTFTRFKPEAGTSYLYVVNYQFAYYTDFLLKLMRMRQLNINLGRFRL
jgi:hypothetical protein